MARVPYDPRAQGADGEDGWDAEQPEAPVIADDVSPEPVIDVLETARASDVTEEPDSE